MDPQKFTYTWGSGGNILLSFFTGNNSDEGVTVYPTGRDIDSGTRATALAETGYGLNGSQLITSSIQQYLAYDNSTDAGTANGQVGVNTASGTTIGALALVPTETVDGYKLSTGNGGYYSGGNLATAVSSQFSGVTKTVLVTYLGASDAKTALTATGTGRQAAHLVAYNGVQFNPYVSSAANSSLIYEGTYTFWSYEHLYYNSIQSTTASDASTLANDLTTNELDQLSSNNVAIASMEVNRSDDGQNVTKGNIPAADY